MSIQAEEILAEGRVMEMTVRTLRAIDGVLMVRLESEDLHTPWFAVNATGGIRNDPLSLSATVRR